MKNTLAENMLRFGPKNLSKLNRKNLKRLTETFTPTNGPGAGIIYKSNFANQANFDKYVAGAIPKSDQLQLAFKATHPFDASITTSNVTSAIWHAAAFTGALPAVNSIDTQIAQLGVFIMQGVSGSSTIVNLLNLSKIQDALDNKKWWNTLVADPTNPTKQISNWSLFVRTNIMPYWSAKKALVQKPTISPE